ncbi:uracil-DNA glycosylase [uncultured Marinococcus sp.]|uniref:uracil-DNA glycosylase n=1 Tax=uncultured Marinococcus sp. TaxID=487012 RepID=UPI00260229DA|nr:uracil-DNA glycosylase [uncultured Marinococcus sp.]
MLPEAEVKEAKKRMEGHQCEGFLDGPNPPDPLIMMIGEAPGETEITGGGPYDGRAGRQFLSYLELLPYPVENIYVTRTVKSRPYRWSHTPSGVPRKYNRTPNQKEIMAHAPLLDWEIRSAAPKIICPMGRTPYWRLLGYFPPMPDVAGKQFTSSVRQVSASGEGYIWSREHYLIFPLYHPAASLYNRSLEAVIRKHFYGLNRLLSNL